MKKFMLILSIFLLISFHFIVIDAFANPEPRILNQGIYNVRDANLLLDTPYTIKLASPNDKAIIIIIDSDQTIEALARLNPRVEQQILPPLKSDSTVIIFTGGSVIFS